GGCLPAIFPPQQNRRSLQ
ncbi:hypothetical protein EC900091_0594, partial [Escherichia coli 90.0091]